MPTKRVSAAALRQAIALAKNQPIDNKSRTIKQNLKRTLAKIQSVPLTRGTGLCNQKGSI